MGRVIFQVGVADGLFFLLFFHGHLHLGRVGGVSLGIGDIISEGFFITFALFGGIAECAAFGHLGGAFLGFFHDGKGQSISFGVAGLQLSSEGQVHIGLKGKGSGDGGAVGGVAQVDIDLHAFFPGAITGKHRQKREAGLGVAFSRRLKRQGAQAIQRDAFPLGKGLAAQKQGACGGVGQSRNHDALQGVFSCQAGGEVILGEGDGFSGVLHFGEGGHRRSGVFLFQKSESGGQKSAGR